MALLLQLRSRRQQRSDQTDQVDLQDLGGVRGVGLGAVLLAEGRAALDAVDAAERRTRRAAGSGPAVVLVAKAGASEELLAKLLAAYAAEPGAVEVAVLETGDRLWLLPDTFGTPPELPMPLLAELAEVVRGGRKVGLAGRDPDAYVLARDALMLLLDDSGGRA